MCADYENTTVKKRLRLQPFALLSVDRVVVLNIWCSLAFGHQAIYVVLCIGQEKKVEVIVYLRMIQLQAVDGQNKKQVS